MSTQPAAHRLSKSRFLAGLQCHKQLWWRVHEPHAPELVPGPALENVLKQGTEVGRVARERFPAGVLIDLPFHEWDNRVAERAAGMHFNPGCRHPDLGNLFVREDVTAVVEGALLGIPDEIAAQQRMLDGPLPDVPIGDHCTRPHECPFLDRCWPRLPDHHVSSLYRIERKKALEYEADGYATIYDLPSDLELSAIHARQVKAVTSGRMGVEPTLARALAAFHS